MEHIGQIIGLLMIAVPLVAGAAIMVARVSMKKLKRSILFLLFAPALAMAAVMGLGSLFSANPGEPFYNIAFAVMLIGTIAVIPWMVVCGIGIAIGFAIRRRNPPSDPTPPSEPSVVPAPEIVPPMQAEPHFSHGSPDGSIRIDLLPVEWAASQWVNTPRVVQVEGERMLCNLMGTDWDANVSFPRERYVWLGLRRYRSPGYLFAEFDLDANRYRIAMSSLDTPEEEGPLGDVTDRLEYWWRKATAIAASRVTKEMPVAAPGPFTAWRTALVILAGAVAAIAGLSWFSLKTGIEPPSVRTIPHIPKIPH